MYKHTFFFWQQQLKFPDSEELTLIFNLVIIKMHELDTLTTYWKIIFTFYFNSVTIRTHIYVHAFTYIIELIDSSNWIL